MAVSVREERRLRIFTAVAMWVAGGATIAASALLGSVTTGNETYAYGLAAYAIAVALFTAVQFPRASPRGLHWYTNVFCLLGMVTVAASAALSGGGASPLTTLYVFPALYAAYFFGPRGMAVHLALYAAIGLTVDVLVQAPDTRFLATRSVLLLAGTVALCVAISWHKSRLMLVLEAVREQALRDPLTGAHNLRGLRDQVDGRPLADGTGLLVIDLDNFKRINSRYGHIGADSLLTAVVNELARHHGARGCVARIGGDEFVVLARDHTPEQLDRLRTSCTTAADRAAATVGMGAADVSVSVGLARWPDDGRNLDALIAAADATMLDRKRASHRSRAQATTHADHGATARVVASIAPVAHARGHGPLPAPRPRLWRRWPARCLANVAAWWAAALSIGLLLALSGAELDHPAGLAALGVLAVGAGAMLLVLAPRLGDGVYVAANVVAAASLVAVLALTGGTISPLLPFALAPVTLAAYFASRREAVLQLAVAALLCATPMAYAAADDRLAYAVRFVALITTAAVITVMFTYNRRVLAEAEQRARRQAEQDPLTALPNRRAFSRLLEQELAAADADERREICAAIIDLDNFKRVNDLHGHAAGDRLLRGLADALKACVRHDDVVARIGGDEFAIVLPEGGLPIAHALGERCVAAVEATAARLGYAGCAVSATIGLAQFRRDGVTAEALLTAADDALMRGKDTGKRRVMISETLPLSAAARTRA